MTHLSPIIREFSGVGTVGLRDAFNSILFNRFNNEVMPSGYPSFIVHASAAGFRVERELEGRALLVNNFQTADGAARHILNCVKEEIPMIRQGGVQAVQEKVLTDWGGKNSVNARLTHF